MEKRKNPVDSIVERYLESLQLVKVRSNEIVISFKKEDLSKFGIGKTKAGSFILLCEAGIWKNYDNDNKIRFDNRPSSQGGPQLHIKNRQGIELAYRSNGARSERRRFTAPSTKAIRDIVRNYFDLPDNVQIESYFINYSENKTQLLIEARILDWQVKMKNSGKIIVLWPGGLRSIR